MKRKCNLKDEQQWLPEALAMAGRLLIKSNVLVSSAKLITRYAEGQKKKKKKPGLECFMG